MLTLKTVDELIAAAAEDRDALVKAAGFLRAALAPQDDEGTIDSGMVRAALKLVQRPCMDAAGAAHVRLRDAEFHVSCLQRQAERRDEEIAHLRKLLAAADKRASDAEYKGYDKDRRIGELESLVREAWGQVPPGVLAMELHRAVAQEKPVADLALVAGGER